MYFWAEIVAATIDLNAATGIGADGSFDITGASISADTTTGAINLDSLATAGVTVTSLTTDTGSIQFDQTGDQTLGVTLASTTDGAITLTNDDAALTATSVTAGGSNNIQLTTTTGGNVRLGAVNAVDNQVTVTSAAAIEDDGTNDVAAEIVAATIDLNAATGIGAGGSFDVTGTSISADSTTGAINLDSLATAGVTVTSLTTDTGSIQFDQTGGQTLSVTLASTTDGAITLTNDDAALTVTSVTAGGSNNIQLTTITGGNVALGAVDAAGNQVTVTSAAAIEDDGTDDGTAEIVAATIDLNAATGIGADGSFDITGASISANTTTGAINLDSLATAGVTVTSLTTDTGSIQFDQTGGQTLDVTLASTANGAITLTNDNAALTATSVAAGGSNDIQLLTTTSGNLNVGSLTAGNDIDLEAAGDITQGAGTITTAIDGSLSMKSDGGLSMTNYTVANTGSTDLTLDSTGDSVTVTGSTADNWNSITASAQYNVVLSGDGDITTGDLESKSANSGVRIFTDTGSGGSLIAEGTINSVGYVEVAVEGSASFADTVTAGGNIELEAVGNLEINDDLTSTGGGVSLISETGKIYTSGGFNDTINVAISGYSAAGTGVDLDPSNPGSGEAAIMIRTKDDLILGSDAELGDPVDVAIYLRSNRVVAGEPSGNVTVGSKVTIGDNGSMIVDAGEKVIFEGIFNESVFNQTTRLEVVSRVSDDLNQVVRYNRLPFADDPESIRNWFNETSTGYFAGAYVLRGVKTLLAEVLALTNPVPLVPPRTLEPEFRSEVEGPDTEALANLLSELGIGVQPYVTEAYADFLSTDLRLYKAAEKLQELMPILEETNGTRIAALRKAVAQYFPTLDSLSEEQMESFTQILENHKGDGTDFDLAGQCIFALREYVNILSTEIGWPVEKSVEFVMGRYVPRITENDEIRIAVIQMHLQK